MTLDATLRGHLVMEKCLITAQILIMIFAWRGLIQLSVEKDTYAVLTDVMNQETALLILIAVT